MHKMFKILLIISVATCLFLVAAEESFAERFYKVADECKTKSGISEEIIHKLRKGEDVDIKTPKVLEQAQCICESVGLTAQNGTKIDKQVLKGRLSRQVSEEVAAKIAEACTVEKTCFELMGCIHRHDEEKKKLFQAIVN